VNALQIEVGLLFDHFGGVFGDQAGGGQGLRGGDFNGQPGAEAIFVAPDAGHFWPGIAWDQGFTSCITDSKWKAFNHQGQAGVGHFDARH
jgi:hypothetical protein